MVVSNSNDIESSCDPCPRVLSHGFGIVLVAALMAAAMLAQCMTVPAWKDEQMYITAGAMCLGQRMYVDFAFLQMPNLPLLLAWVNVLGGGHYLLDARMVAFAFYMLAAWAVFAIALRWTRRPWLALGAAAIFAFNPTVARAMPYAYNLGPAIAVGLWGVHVLLGAIAENNRRLMPYFGGGLLFGLAVGFKLFLAAPALAALAFTLVVGRTLCNGSGATAGLSGSVGNTVGQANRGTRQETLFHLILHDRIGHAGLFSLGMALALLPSIYYLFRAGDRFLFDNLGYHVLNVQWWASWPCAEAIDLPRKAWMLLCELGRPANLALIAAVIALKAISRRRSAGGLALFCAVLFILSLLAAISPSPAWPHYLAMPLAFGLALCLVYCAAAIESGRARAATIIMFIFMAITLGDGAAGLGRTVAKLAHPTRWPPVAVHLTAEKIRLALSPWHCQGMTATLSPLYAVEAGLELMPEFAATDFLFRNGDYLTAEQRKRFVTTSPRTVDGLFAKVRPRVIIIVPDEPRPGEPILEKPLFEFAERNGYYSRGCDDAYVFISRDHN
jgi:hypothetical protein